MELETKIKLTLLLLVATLLALTFTAKAQPTTTCPGVLTISASLGGCTNVFVGWTHSGPLVVASQTLTYGDGLSPALSPSAKSYSREGVGCGAHYAVTVVQHYTNGQTCMAYYNDNHNRQCSDPTCSSASSSLSIVNAANFRDAQTDDAIAALYSGVDMTNGSTATAGNIPLPQSLLGCKVYVGNPAFEAGIFFVSPLQLNFWIPQGVPAGIQQVTATTYSGQTLYGTVNIQPNSPGIFTQNGTGQGVAQSLWFVTHANGSQQSFLPGQLPPLSGTDIVGFVLYGTSIKGSFSTLSLSNGRSYDSFYTGKTIYPGLIQLNYVIPVNEVWRTTLGASVRVWNGNTKGNGFWDSQTFDVR